MAHGSPPGDYHREPPEVPPKVDRPSWICPGCDVCYDGRPEIVTEDPLECYCSRECYESVNGAENGGTSAE